MRPGDIPDEDKARIPASIQAHLKNKEIVNILKEFDVDAEGIRQLSAMSGIVESAEDIREKREVEDEYGDVLDVMADVPAGCTLNEEQIWSRADVYARKSCTLGPVIRRVPPHVRPDRYRSSKSYPCLR